MVKKLYAYVVWTEWERQRCGHGGHVYRTSSDYCISLTDTELHRPITSYLFTSVTLAVIQNIITVTWELKLLGP